jgi:predicted transcriptional regulator
MLERKERAVEPGRAASPSGPLAEQVWQMARTTTRPVNWAVDVASRLKGAHFPLEEEEARERLEGVTVKGNDINDVLDRLQFPIATPAEMLRLISEGAD